MTIKKLCEKYECFKHYYEQMKQAFDNRYEHKFNHCQSALIGQLEMLKTLELISNEDYTILFDQINDIAFCSNMWISEA